MDLDSQLLLIVNNITSTLRHDLKRPLRILDLKCAHGYFNFNFVTAGDEIFSLDELSENISFDFVFGFGMFNQLLEQGVEAIHEWMRELSQRASTCLIEMPKKINDPYYLLNPFTYTEKICLKNYSPLYFCSDRYWYGDGFMRKFDSWTDVSHDAPWMNSRAFTHHSTRRYYFTKDEMLKRYLFRGEAAKNNKEEISTEINFLLNNCAKIKKLPQVLNFKMDESEAWLIRKKVPGITLTAAIKQNIYYDPKTIITTVLEQCVQLESHGLYHTDLRPWNIILLENGEASMIDYGSIRPVKCDIRSRKKHVYFSFLIFAYEIIHRKVIRIRHFNATYINKKHYPPEFHTWIQSLLCVDFSKWSFDLFLKHFCNYDSSHTLLFTQNLDRMLAWLDEAEIRLTHPKFKIKYLEKRFVKYFEQRLIRKLSKELARAKLLS
jgi:predicted Ser/Thr protein kinase